MKKNVRFGQTPRLTHAPFREGTANIPVREPSLFRRCGILLKIRSGFRKNRCRREFSPVGFFREGTSLCSPGSAFPLVFVSFPGVAQFFPEGGSEFPRGL